MKANDLSRFTFKKVSSGAYRVTYTRERGDYFDAIINYMPIIDATLHAEWAKLEDIKDLARMVRNNGGHYHPDGTKFY